MVAVYGLLSVDLAIEKLSDRDSVKAEEEITYTITYGNNGLADATGVVIRESVPDRTHYVPGSATHGGVYDPTTRTITWKIGDVAAETNGLTVVFSVTVDVSLKEGGWITNATYFITSKETGAVVGRAVKTEVKDTQPPQLSGERPADGAAQIPRNTVIELRVTDGGSGVNLNSVQIRVEGDLIYDGGDETPVGSDGAVGFCDTTGAEQAVKGRCKRTGNKSAYRFVFRSASPFGWGQTVRVDVTASDLGVEPNTLDKQYSFTTTARPFGRNFRVNSGDSEHTNPGTARDAQGNIWVAWERVGATGVGSIFIAKAGADTRSLCPQKPNARPFCRQIEVASGERDRRNPGVAVDEDGNLYVTYEQDNAADGTGWDVYVARASVENPNAWVAAAVCSANGDQTRAAIAVDSNRKVYVAWQDARGAAPDIWLGASADHGATWAEKTQVTNQPTAQTEPAIAIDANNGVYLAWTDARNTATQGTDIYVASSTDAPAWTNHVAVNSPANQSQPAIAMESAGTIGHLVWTDDRNGNADIYYGATPDDFPKTPVVGGNVVDDTKGKAQTHPAITVTGDAAASDVNVFVCWQDSRDATEVKPDTDIYFWEGRTDHFFWGGDPKNLNVLVNDDVPSDAAQTVPCIGVDKRDKPYMAWADTRDGQQNVYAAGAALFVHGEVEPNDHYNVSVSTGGSGKVAPNDRGQPANGDDVIVHVPAGAVDSEVSISIEEASDPPPLPADGFGVPFSFGPSGATFQKDITITIPFNPADFPDRTTYKVYWYDSESNQWLPHTDPRSGIRADSVEHIVSNNGLDCIRFQAEHFSMFGVGGENAPQDPDNAGGPVGGGGGGGGGGSCSMSSRGTGDWSLGLLLTAALGLVAVRRRRSPV